MKPDIIQRTVAVALLCAAVQVQARSYLLVTNNPSLPADLESAVAAAGGRVTLSLPQIGVAVAESASDQFAGTAGKISGIGSVLPDVEWQTEEPLYGAMESVVGEDAVPVPLPPTDTRYPLQWGLAAINAPGAWAAGHTGAGVRVAVLDSGLASAHSDLAGNVNTALSTSFVPGEVYNYTYVPGSTNRFSHGTHVAGIIAAKINNGFGSVGVAPQAEIVGVKVLRTATGSGSLSWIMAGIVYAADIDADIINMSLGGSFPRRGYVSNNGTPSDPSDDFKVGANELSELVTALGRATRYAYQRGTTIIASAGNSALDRDHDADLWILPADCPHVIGVSATAPLGWAKNQTGTFLDSPASYSNYGQSRVDFAAPGGDFDYTPDTETSTVSGVTTRTYVFDGVYSPSNRIQTGASSFTTYWAWAAGTSMAAPHVSGVAALIIGKNGGSMHPAAVEAALRASADDLGKPGKDDFYGHGRVNAAKAVE